MYEIEVDIKFKVKNTDTIDLVMDAGREGHDELLLVLTLSGRDRVNYVYFLLWSKYLDNAEELESSRLSGWYQLTRLFRCYLRIRTCCGV